MDLSRRRFLGMAGASVAAPRLFAKAKADYDPDLTVLLSDIHVNGVKGDAEVRLRRGRDTEALPAPIARGRVR